MLLGILYDMHHHLKRFHRIFALGCLAGQHHRVRTVVYGVGNVGNFRPGRTWIADHGIQHLGCRDDRLIIVITFLDHHLLQIGHFLRRDLYAQVPAGHHDSVRAADDLIDVLNPFRILDLSDNWNIWRAALPKECLDLQDALCIADKGSRDKVNLLLYAEADILSVLIGNGRQAHRYIRHIDAFALSEFSSIDYGTDDLLGFLFLYFQANQAIIHKNRASNLHVLNQTRVSNRHFALVANNILCR